MRIMEKSVVSKSSGSLCAYTYQLVFIVIKAFPVFNHPLT